MNPTRSRSLPINGKDPFQPAVRYVNAADPYGRTESQRSIRLVPAVVNGVKDLPLTLGSVAVAAALLARLLEEAGFRAGFFCLLGHTTSPRARRTFALFNDIERK